MGSAMGKGQDVFNLDASQRQRIGDQRPMTAPRHGFGAHQCEALSMCPFQQGAQMRLEFWGLHVVGEPSE
jgi:hypothetical protein